MSLDVFMILPPIVFIVLLLFFLILAFFTKKISYKSGNNPKGKTKAYASGEDVKNHRIRPNYSEFFPYAFFFTIMHVITLIIATSPKSYKGILPISILFIIVAFLSIFIIFRREDND